MKTSQILIALLTLGFTACSAKIDASSPVPNVAAGVDASAYNGTWKTGCVANGNFFFTSTNLVILDGTYKLQSGVYDDNACTHSISSSPDDSGTFVIGAGDPSTILEIDLYAPRSGGATQIYYDIIKLEGNRFFLGDQKTMDSTGRPKDIDYTKPYIKQ